jgi:hypothetical protein
MIRNRIALSAHVAATPLPRAADPAVVAMGDPLPYRSPWRRPGSLLATAVAAVLLALLVNGEIGNLRDTIGTDPRDGGMGVAPSQPAPAAAYGPVAGECISSNYYVVSCADTTATWRLVEQVQTADQCQEAGYPDAFTDTETNEIWCAEYAPTDGS